LFQLVLLAQLGVALSDSFGPIDIRDDEPMEIEGIEVPERRGKNNNNNNNNNDDDHDDKG